MAYKKKVLEKKICVICGKEFQPRIYTQLTCSRECAYKRQIKYVNEKSKEKRRLEREATPDPLCAICGKPFTRSGHKMTCSPECSRIKKRITEKANMEKRKRGGLEFAGYDTSARFIESERKRKSAHKPTHSLAETIKAAKERGMSYGEYVARYGL